MEGACPALRQLLASRPMATPIPLPKFEAGPMLGWGAGGMGAALLENATLFEDQPDEIKHINAVLGAATGAVMSHPDNKIKALAALGWPVKQMALMSIGKAEQFRKDQSDLLDKKLQAAEIDLSAAEERRRAAGGNKALMAAFLLPAILGGGGLAYHAWNKRKREQPARFATTDEHGRPHGRQRVKIEVPAGALPDEFFKSLVNVDDNPRSLTRLQELRPAEPKQASAESPQDRDAYNRLWRKHWSNPSQTIFPQPEKDPTTLGQVANVAGELTGVPQTVRGFRELDLVGDALRDDRLEDIPRYALAGLGNLGMGISGLNLLTAPALGWAIGRDNVRSWLPKGHLKGMKRQLTAFPNLGRWLYRHSWGNKLDPSLRSRGGGPAMTQGARRAGLHASGGLVRPSPSRTQPMSRKDFMRGGYDRARDIRYRSNPDMFAWDRGEVVKRYSTMNAERVRKGLQPLKVPNGSSLVSGLLSKSTTPPKTFLGGAVDAARFGANRGVNAAYRATMLARRNPNAAMFFAGMPLIGMGLERDKQHQEGANALLRKALPNYENRRGYGGTPISGTLSNLLGMVGANPAPGIANQL